MTGITAYIGFGSNIGRGQETILRAWRLLGAGRGVTTLRLSAPYRSTPVDMDSDRMFTNAVGMVESVLAPGLLLDLMQEVEEKLGRRRDGTGGHRDRTLDLDLLVYGGLRLLDERLRLPHPGIGRRLFVLAPLAELTPELVLPGQTRTIAEISFDFTAENSTLPPGTRQTILRDSWRKKTP